MLAHIARQPIFDFNRKICGYELLYRSGTDGNTAHILDADSATQSLLSDAITVFGLSELTGDKPAYINFTRNLLMDDLAYLADPKEIVVEVPAEIVVDDLLLQKLNALRKAGYRIALEGYNEQNGRFKFDRILQAFDIITVDIRENNRLRQKSILNRLRSAHVLLMATRVETLDDYSTARSLGFVLFQGYYFQKPEYIGKRIPPLSASPHGRLINELLRPNPGFDACIRIIQLDPVLRHMFFQRAEAAGFRRNPRGTMTEELRHALVMLGTEELRRWVGLVLLKQNNVTRSDETARKAYFRGRFIERLMENSDTALDPRQGFLLGLFSLLNQVMGVSMESLLDDLDMMPPLKAALLGTEENEYSLFLQFAVIYEMSNPRLILPDIGLRLTGLELSDLYMECIAETDAAFSATGGTAE